MLDSADELSNSVVVNKNQTVRIGDTSSSVSDEEEEDPISLESWTVLNTTVVLQTNATEKRVDEIVQLLTKDTSFLDNNTAQTLMADLVKFSIIPEVSASILRCYAPFFKRVHNTMLASQMGDALYDLFQTPEHRKLAFEALKILFTSLPQVDFIRQERSGREIRLIWSLIESVVPRIVGGITQENISLSLDLVSVLLQSHAYFLRSHQKHKNIHFWGNWFCTGIELGKGSYAQVYLGRHIQTAKAVAIKSMQWDKLTFGKPKLEEQLRNEIEIMKISKHPNIVQLYDVVRDGGLVNLMLEFCGDGSLEDYLKKHGKLSEKETIYWLKDLALGLKFLRDRGIIHRDLKPGNLLIATEDGVSRLKITDFTFARFIEPGDLATTLVGTPLYMAPEIFDVHRYTDKADLWSIGIIVYQMLTGDIPFSAARATNYIELLHFIQNGELIFPPNLSAPMKSLLKGLLHKNPDLRLSWTEFFLHPCLGIGNSDENSDGDDAWQKGKGKDHEGEMSEATKKELEGLRSEVARLRLKDKLNEDTMQGLKAQVADFHKRAEEARVENERLKAELARGQLGQDDWLKQLQKEQQISEGLKTELNLWKQRAAEGEHAVEILKTKFQAQLAELMAERDKLAAKVAGSSGSSTSSPQAADYGKLKEKMENDLRLLREDNEQLKGENKRLRDRLDQTQNRVSAASRATEEMKKLESMLEMWQREKQKDVELREDLLREYEAQLQKKDQKINALKARLQVLEVALEAEASEHGLKSSYYKVRIPGGDSSVHVEGKK